MTFEVHAQACPLCGNGAQFRFVDDSNRKHFSCFYCTEFQIAVGIEELVSTVPARWRKELAYRARSRPEGKTLCITTARTQAKDSPVFDAHYVPNSKLLV